MWIGFIAIWFVKSLIVVILYIIYGIAWIVNIIIGFFGALIGMAIGGFGTSMPSEVNTLFSIIFIAFLALIILSLIRLLRGVD